MSGQKGLTVVVVAILLTVLCAYCLNVHDEQTTTTTYSRVSDLAPVVESDGTAQEYIEYAPAANVTGWLNSDGTNPVPTTTAGSIYRLSPTYTDYTTTTATVSSGTYVTVLSTGYSTAYNAVKLSNGDYWSYTGAAPTINGGPDSVSYTVTTTTPHQTVTWYCDTGYWCSASQILAAATISDGAVLYFGGSTVHASASAYSVYANNSHTGSYYYKHYGLTTSGAEYTGTAVRWTAATETWSVGSWNGSTSTFTASMSNLADFYLSVSGSSALSFTVATPVAHAAVYADPTKMVPIDGSSNVYVTWSNSMNNGKITVLASVDWGLRVAYNDGGDYSYLAIDSAMSAYDYVLYTLDFQNGAWFWQGVVDFVGPQQYTVVEYRHEGGDTSAGVSYATSLRFYGNLSHMQYAYIVSTWVGTDPDGLLWHDATINLGYYFPDQMENDTRVVLNGFVTYPESLAVNGQSYTVNAGYITVDGTALALSGLTIDYTSTAVTLTSGTATADLGARSSDVITAGGTSYFGADLYKVSHSTVTSKVLDTPGVWHSTTNEALLVFLAMCGVGLMLAVYRRDSWGATDWFAVIVAAFVAFSMLVI